ncbi:GNAT family N-acetyltransferase [Neobacillus dielmonensis]|uniref:GNAT family N-acetyltransferase n=1 Tax=Neobacillus dielmonensis TaxID=1347369 RepID=UPI0005A8B01B|nr:GNAT family N-acetyltransferase [Neobacillus dielmonensis]
MIRKLTKSDNTQVMDFLSSEPSMNLFIIGDIEAFGYESEFQEIWGEFNAHNQLNAVLLRYFNSFIPYAKGEFDVAGFACIMMNHDQQIVLSGKSNIVEQFDRLLESKLGKKQVTYFAECRSTDQLISNFNGKGVTPIHQAGINDIDRILELRKSIEEFTVQKNAREMMVSSMESHTAKTYFTEDNGSVTACVSTAAENSISAMIVGVCTKQEYRRQGLATAIMIKLFKDVLDEGKILCLFYDNPDAGRIYKRLGFKDIGLWTMYR